MEKIENPLEDDVRDITQRIFQNIYKQPLQEFHSRYGNGLRNDVIKYWKDFGITDNLAYSLGIKNQRILELGCGANASPDDTIVEESFRKDPRCAHLFAEGTYKRMWQPSLSRFMALAGAKVTGIDTVDSPNEPYNHLSIDLTKTSLTRILGENRFDKIFAVKFFDSPALHSSLPEIGIDDKTFFDWISVHVKNLLSPGGLYHVGEPNMTYEEASSALTRVGFQVLEPNEYQKKFPNAIILAKKPK